MVILFNAKINVLYRTVNYTFIVFSKKSTQLTKEINI